MRIFILALVASLVACKEVQHNNVKEDVEQDVSMARSAAPAIQDSSRQWLRLLQLASLAKAEASAAISETQITGISEKYKGLIHHYLTDSCHSVIHAIPVHVEQVESINEKVFISLSHGVCKFYSYVSKGGKDEPEISQVYNRALALRSNSDTRVQLAYLGECDAGFFKDEFEVNIKAVPVPSHINLPSAVLQQLRSQ